MSLLPHELSLMLIRNNELSRAQERTMHDIGLNQELTDGLVKILADSSLMEYLTQSGGEIMLYEQSSDSGYRIGVDGWGFFYKNQPKGEKKRAATGVYGGIQVYAALMTDAGMQASHLQARLASEVRTILTHGTEDYPNRTIMLPRP